MTSGEKIRNIRIQKNLSQKQLAEKVRMSEPAIRNYELGNRTPSQKQIELIADALGVSPFALSDPNLDTYYGIMHALFYLENTIGLHPIEIDGQTYLALSPTDSKSKTTYADIQKWHTAFQQVNQHEISEKEYKEWKDTFPKHITLNKR